MSTFFIEVLQTVATVCGILLINAILVACEFSLVKQRYSAKAADDAAPKGGTVGRLLNKTAEVARLFRFGSTACAVALAIVLFPFVEGTLEELLGFTPWFTAVIAFFIAVGAQYILADLLPRALGFNYPDRSLAVTAPVVLLLLLLLRPLINGVHSLTARAFRWIGLPTDTELNLLDVEVQIRALGIDGPPLSPQLRKILSNCVRMSELEVSDILLPRNQIQYFDINNPMAENIELARRTGHTRFPLCDGDLDHCLGIIHIKDVFRWKGGVETLDPRKLRRNITSLSADEPVEAALEKLLRLRMHMALVVDEFGGTVGIVTLEGILEELVGDIRDEFDAYEEAEIVDLADGAVRVSGLTAIHDIEEHLQVRIETNDVSTIGGLITAELGRIPSRGEQLTIENASLQVTVNEVDEKRVISATLRVVSREEEN